MSQPLSLLSHCAKGTTAGPQRAGTCSRWQTKRHAASGELSIAATAQLYNCTTPRRREDNYKYVHLYDKHRDREHSADAPAARWTRERESTRRSPRSVHQTWTPDVPTHRGYPRLLDVDAGRRAQLKTWARLHPPGAPPPAVTRPGSRTRMVSDGAGELTQHPLDLSSWPHLARSRAPRAHAHRLPSLALALISHHDSYWSSLIT